MNEGRRFQLSTGAQLPPKQIDVMAVDQDTILVVECKASEERRPRSLQKDINETRGLKPGIISSLRRHFGSGMKVCFIYATRNIQWSRPDLARADDCQVFVLRDRGIDYYRQLADIIGPAARHQLQADVLKGTPVPGLRTQVSALQGRLGGKKFYQFAIEPERLLKLSYISHRANIDAEAIGTYQRILKKNRLREISQYIEDHDGVFPTNIVVNFRTRRGLRFDPAGPSTSDDPMVMGTLYLPNTYKSAWVIDGQHRLYGFALSGWASRAKVPVLAFENLDPKDEAQLFVDINNKQVRVPKRLLVLLDAELHWGSKEPADRLKALHSELAVQLSEHDDSPLWGKVTAEWDPKPADRPITLPELTNAMTRTALIGSMRENVFVPGHLYVKDEESTVLRAREVCERCLEVFAEALPEHWARGKQPGGFLCTNPGVAALFQVLKSVLDHLESSTRLNIPMLAPETLTEAVRPFVRPIIDYFKNADETAVSTFRGHYGSSGPRIAAFAIMELVHNEKPDFNPPGLEEHIRSHSSAAVNRANGLITEIEDSIRDRTLRLLKGLYGPEEDGWWKTGVPQQIRGAAALKSELSPEGGEPHQFLDLLDYKKIAHVPSNWGTFELRFTVDRSKRSKDARLEWMDSLNAIRNRTHHSGRRSVNEEELSFLETVWLHIMEHREELQEKGAP